MALSLIHSLQIWKRQFAEDAREAARKIVRRRIRKIIELVMNDLDMVALLKPDDSSVAFENQNLRDVPRYKTRDALFRAALAQLRADDGLFLEFGVYKGASINRLARLKAGARFYGFDSFVGLPEAWTVGSKQAAFNVGGALPPVRENVELIKGFFADTLRPFLAARPGTLIRFIHVDCDLYSATKTILKETRPMLRPGAVIVFDEFFNYPRWEQGEYKALMEFAAETDTRFEYIGYIPTGSQVAIRLL